VWGALGLAVAAFAAKAQESTIPPALYAGLAWRNIGPFRAGRVSAVAGAIGQPGVFYIGLPFGGVWKTTSAGTTWFPVFDAVKEISNIGSIAVAPSDADVVYVGTGDAYRPAFRGNGLYKSTDAGRTWRHLALGDTKIPAILVDPHDPSVVLVAAMGDSTARTETRGVFRSSDGGQSWQKTLSVDNETGVQDLAWAYDQPDVILASTTRSYTGPSAASPGNTAAGVTAIYKSTDQGLTWRVLTGGGLPSPGSARGRGARRVAVAANTHAQRMFLVDGAHLYRSDDGGTSWRPMAAADTRIGTERIYVDSKNPDVLYDMNTSMYRSTDGGATFESFKGAPGGDDPHVLWIDPTDGKRLLLGGDQGATVSFDGGGAWSSWYNQSTAQLYHISTDTSYPYWVYGQQQDSGAVATRSRGDLGAITPLDWYPTPGYEAGYIAADPLNPKIVYACGPDTAGQLAKITYPSGQWINISPATDPTSGVQGSPGPILFSPTNPRELLVGFNYLMATSDGGAHWRKRSPDLGRISSISPSTVVAGVMWVGTTNGLIKLTKNDGVIWSDVTIPGLPAQASIVTIDASHQASSTAYVAVSAGGNKPLLYRTRDYGKTWTTIVAGLPADQVSGSFVNVIRADTKRAGLIFAGTESSVYVSFNDGDEWQPLTLNLPNTAVRDIAIHGNDLVLGTFGRGLWILDDYSPLRQMTSATISEPAHLFKPGEAIRVRRDVNGDTPFPPEVPHAENPPLGAIVYYYVGAKPGAVITLEIHDAAGAIVRHMSSAPMPVSPDASRRNVPDFWIEKPVPMPAEPGAHRVNWNIRYDDPPAFSDHITLRAVPGETPAAYEGPLALPGLYTVTLIVDGQRYTQTVTVRNDPRSPAGPIGLRAQHDLQMKLYAGIREAWDGYQQVAAMRAAIAGITSQSPAPDVTAAASAFDAKLVALTRGGGGRGGSAAGAAAAPSFFAVNDALNRQLEQLDSGDMAPNPPMRQAYVGGCTELKTAVTSWKTINTQDLVAFNAVLMRSRLTPIASASPSLPVPVCVAIATPAPGPAGGRGRGGR
jgi:photosystem II stability/assembly factor-like uncharacterized protein